MSRCGASGLGERRDGLDTCFSLSREIRRDAGLDHGYIMGPYDGAERIDLVIPPLMPWRRCADGNVIHLPGGHPAGRKTGDQACVSPMIPRS